MTGSSEFAIFFFDLFLARITLYAEDLVIIFIFQQYTSKKLMDLKVGIMQQKINRFQEQRKGNTTMIFP